MIALTLSDKKTATTALFTKEFFDYFLVREISITTNHTYTIDGHIQKDYYTEEELECLRDTTLADWKSLRPFCYNLIKGKKLPAKFTINMQLSQDNVARFLNQAGLDYDISNVKGLYLHFYYEQQVLKAVTGTSLNIFTLDKSLDHAWDEMVKQIFKHNEIPFES